jgi:transcriptional regulator with XRE-family HTH domain
MEIEKTFGRKVLELRKARGWKQEELGKKLETSGVVVGRYERGEMMPSIKVAKKMADVFGVTLDYLVGEQETLGLLTQREMVERWSTLDGLTPEDRNRILYVVDSLIREAKTREAFAATG